MVRVPAEMEIWVISREEEDYDLSRERERKKMWWQR